MEMQPTPLFQPGSPEASAALQRFKAYAMSHTLLAEVDKQISRAIHEPAGFAFVLLYGPSGVGKTTLIRQLEHRAGVVREPMFPGLVGGPRHPHPFAPVPLLLLETRPPDGATFNRAEYYQVALKQLGEYPYDPSWEQKKGRGKDVKFNDSAELSFFWDSRGASVGTDPSDRSGETPVSGVRSSQKGDDSGRTGHLSPSHAAAYCTCEQRPSVDQARDNLDQEVARSAVDAPGSFAGSLTLMLTHSQAMLGYGNDSSKIGSFDGT